MRTLCCFLLGGKVSGVSDGGRALALCCCSPVIEVLCPEVEGDVAVEHPSDQGNQEAESCPSLYILQK